jgi:hypothetical protein
VFPTGYETTPYFYPTGEIVQAKQIRPHIGRQYFVTFMPSEEVLNYNDVAIK